MIKISTDHLIVGAGISGLATALDSTNSDFLVIDSKPRAGGVWNTQQYKNIYYELGPNTITNTYTQLNELLTTLKLDKELISSPMKSSRRFIYHKKQLYEISSNPLSILKFLGPWSFSELLWKIFTHKPTQSDKELSTYNWGLEFLGRQVTETLLAPALQGIWAGDMHSLSADYALKKLRKLEKHSLPLFWAWREEPQKSKKEASKILSCKQGLSYLAEQIQNKIGKEKFIFQETITNIKNYNNQYQVTSANYEILCNKLSLTCPAYTSAHLLKDLAPTLSQELEKIHYAPIILIAYTIPKSMISYDLSNSFGYLFTEASECQTLGTIIASELFTERQLPDEYLCISFVGGAKASQGLSYSAPLAKAILKEQAQVLKISPENLGSMKIINHLELKQAIPQFNLGHASIIEKIRSILQEYPQLNLHGNYLDGIAIGDCLDLQTSS